MDVIKKTKILDSLSSHEFVNITNLSKNVNLPRTTLVYYINILVESKEVVKVRGNVKKIDKFSKSESKTLEKMNTNKGIKKDICKRASEFVQDGDIIFIDSGSTTAFLLKYLSDKKITIYTNNILFMDSIPSEGYDPTVYSIPGKVYKKTSSITGSLSIEFIGDIYFDKSFIGVNVITENNLYTTNQTESILKRTVIKNTKESYVLYNKNKISDSVKVGSHKFGTLSEVNEVFA